MRVRLYRLLLVSFLNLLALVPAGMARPAKPIEAVTVAELADQVRMPAQRFTLANGLKVVVFTDRKAPIVAVAVWYHTGSKDEPPGRTGFAHLFEHLMITDPPAAAPGKRALEQLEASGMSESNATTWFDRTNYFHTVPTGAVPLALYVEADRMANALGRIDQDMLDRQRAVVKNERRQSAAAMASLNAQYRAIFPKGHPYGHPVAGSSTDLDRATMVDVRDWYRTHYIPNNAVLVLAGDIDVATARPMVERYFGKIPRGPEVAAPVVAPPAEPRPAVESLAGGPIPGPRLSRSWAVPRFVDPDTVQLDIAARILGGLVNARFAPLLRDEGLAVAQSVRLLSWELGGSFTISVTPAPGQDAGKLWRRLDAILGDFLARGPDAREVRAAATQALTERLVELDRMGGHGSQPGEVGMQWMLAEGALYAGDPEYYAKRAQIYAAATPASVLAAARKWIGGPGYSLTLQPGPVPIDDEAGGPGDVLHAPPAAAQRTAGRPVVALSPPAVAPPKSPVAPPIRRGALANGMRLAFVHRRAAAMTRLVLSFDAGRAADRPDAEGTQALMLRLLDRGTTTLDGPEIAARKELLGAAIRAEGAPDRTTLSLTIPSANLAGGIALVAEMIQHPSFAAIESERSLQLAEIAAEAENAAAIAGRLWPVAIFGPGHPYSAPESSLGYREAVAKVTRSALETFANAWLRPEKATLFVVSDRPFEDVIPVIEHAFGGWRAIGPAGRKRAMVSAPRKDEHILLVDQPGAAQTSITAIIPLPIEGASDTVAFDLGAHILAGPTVNSRLNRDLREQRGWTYFVTGRTEPVAGPMTFTIEGDFQNAKAGAAVQSIRAHLAGLAHSGAITAGEANAARSNLRNGLPGSLERSVAILDLMREAELRHRPDDFTRRLFERLPGIGEDRINAALRADLDPARTLWVVVGPAAAVRPQLEALGLPVETVVVPLDRRP